MRLEAVRRQDGRADGGNGSAGHIHVLSAVFRSVENPRLKKKSTVPVGRRPLSEKKFYFHCILFIGGNQIDCCPHAGFRSGGVWLRRTGDPASRRFFSGYPQCRYKPEEENRGNGPLEAAFIDGDHRRFSFPQEGPPGRPVLTHPPIHG